MVPHGRAPACQARVSLRLGVVDVEAEYAPHCRPSGADCDRDRRDLPAPVAPRDTGLRRNRRPTIADLWPHVHRLWRRPGSDRSRHRRPWGDRQLRHGTGDKHNQVRGQHSPGDRPVIGAQQSDGDRKREPFGAAHRALWRPSVAHSAHADRHRARNLTHRGSDANRVGYANPVKERPAPRTDRIGRSAHRQHDRARRRFHASYVRLRYQDCKTSIEPASRSSRAGHD